MTNFPMFIDLSGKSVLIIGGGQVALRKIQKLLPFHPSIRVVAPEILPEISDIPGIRVSYRPYRPWDLVPLPSMVICATGNRKINHQVSSACRKLKIPVNVADDPALCTFLFPSIVTEGSFSAGFSTGGASPTFSRYFREQIQSHIPENLDEILIWMSHTREEIKRNLPPEKRAGILRTLLQEALCKGRPLSESETNRCMENRKIGCVSLVGAGCGKADLITLRGLRLIQQCDALVYDDLIDTALLDAAPEGAARIYMGKRSGAHSASQQEICKKLIELAASGLNVVRLKGGDPYLFGRGGEEMLALQEAGIPCQEVPGIPSPIGIPAEAGIPVTHRGVSRGLHIMTAHTTDTSDGFPEDFDHLAKLKDTLVFLMGLKQLDKICSRLIAAGKDPATPAAVISGGNSPNPATIRGSLSDLPALASGKVASPAIILVGEVASMDLTMADFSTLDTNISHIHL